MIIFELDDNKQVKLNKPWILQIPEFATLYKRDKRSEGDYDGRRKLRTHREFTFIFFYTDFTSPLRNWDADERFKESLVYAGLEEKDIDEPIKAAVHKYEELQHKATRSLRTLKSIMKGMDAFDNYLETVDFSKTDADGRLVNSTDKFVNQIAKVNKMYDEVQKFEKRVEQELKEGGTGIRGTAIKGENEDKVDDWSEADILTGSSKIASRGKATTDGGGPKSNGVTMIGIGKLINGKDHKTKFSDQELEEEEE